MMGIGSPGEVALAPFPYEGPEDLRAPIFAALDRVIDPELAMTFYAPLVLLHGPWWSGWAWGTRTCWCADWAR